MDFAQIELFFISQTKSFLRLFLFSLPFENLKLIKFANFINIKFKFRYRALQLTAIYDNQGSQQQKLRVF